MQTMLFSGFNNGIERYLLRTAGYIATQQDICTLSLLTPSTAV